MTATTKARTEGEKRRSKAARAALVALSGVDVSAAGAPSKPQKDPMRCALDNRCRLMGWPLDDAHRARARDERLGTLYGRLAVAGRLSEDAFLGVEAWDRLERAAAQVKGTRRVCPNDFTSKDQEPDPDFIAAERDAAWAMLKDVGIIPAQLVTAALDSEADLWPARWPVGYDRHLEAAGLALASHFGLAA